jgi:hypothetical protein
MMRERAEGVNSELAEREATQAMQGRRVGAIGDQEEPT